MNDCQYDLEECIRMKTHGDITEWVTMRKRAWDEHKQICRRQGVPPLPWETFKRLVMRLDTFQEMVDMGVLQARRITASATIIPLLSNNT